MSNPPPIVVDADGHVCEPADPWGKNLPPHLRDNGIRLRWNADTGYDECSFADFGRGMHYEEISPAGFDPRERVKVLDSEGIDLAVLYPGLGLKLGAIR